MQSSNRQKPLEKEQDSQAPTSSPQSRPRAGNSRRVALIVVLVLLILAAGTLGAALLLKNTPGANTATHTIPGQGAPDLAALAANANGVVNFTDQPGGAGHNNAISMSINSLLRTPSSYHYDAWFVDTTTKHRLALGTLTFKNQVYSLAYSDHGANLLGLGNEIDITLEHGAVTVPSGKVLLSAAFPAQAFVYVKRMLYSFSNTPGKIALLAGLIDQAKLLNTVAHQLTTSLDAAAIQCIAQSALDILEGKAGSHYQTLAANCSSQGISRTGDGYGLLGANGYIANSQAQDLLANNQPDATSVIHEHSKHVTYGLQDMKSWLTTAEQDALTLLNDPANSGKVQELATLASHAYYGYDANHDGTIDYVPGEAGAMIAYQHGQYMTAMVLAPVS